VRSYVSSSFYQIFTDSEHVRRNAAIQIVLATLAFILLVRVFPMGLVQNHVYSKQAAFDRNAGGTLTGDAFTSNDKKLQMVYFQEEHIQHITLYMNCIVDSNKTETILFRIYDENFTCVFDEELACNTIEKQGYLTATPDLDVEKDKAYYYEVLIPEETSAQFALPVGDRTALGQFENSTLYIDGIINDDVCLVADFDYASPLSVEQIVLYDLLIIAAAVLAYILLHLGITFYDVHFDGSGRIVGKVVRIMASILIVAASAAFILFSVVKNGFGGEIWDRLFFLIGIIVGALWILAALWIPAWYPKPKKQLKISVKGKIASTWRDYIQTVSFGMLFYALCQYVNADRMQYQFTNTRWMLIFLAIALLMNYNEKIFLNKISASWIAFGIVGSILYCKSVDGDENAILLARLACGVVVSWGLLIINIVLALVNDKTLSFEAIVIYSRRNKKSVLCIVLWVVFALLMYLYRYEKVWVYTATLPFIALFFTKSIDAAKSRFLKNFTNGILLSFGFVVLFCLLHRPHHYWMLYRYGGMFHTVACTGMYLAVVFGAVLAKLYGRIKDKRNMFLRCSFEYFVTACTVGFIILTMSRTAFLTTTVTVAAIVLLTAATYHKGFSRIAVELGLLVLVCIVSFPMVFSAVRIIPALVNDPVRYDLEFQDKGFMIYEGDPIDSDKYMTVRRFFSTLFGRFHTDAAEEKTLNDLIWTQEEVLLAYTGKDFAGADLKKAEEEEEQVSDISNGRFAIFRVYLGEIGMKGHPKMGPKDEYGLEYAHAHNSYLQVAYNFGMIAGGVFIILYGMTFYKGIMLFYKKGTRFGMFLVPYAMIVVFGFVSLTEWAFHPCIPAGFSFILMQVFLLK